MNVSLKLENQPIYLIKKQNKMRSINEPCGTLFVTHSTVELTLSEKTKYLMWFQYTFRASSMQPANPLTTSSFANSK